MLSTDQLVNDGRYGIVGNSTLEHAVETDISLTPDPIEDALSITDHNDFTKFLRSDVERPPISDVLRWADQLLDAIHKRHTLVPPAIHGQIAPANILLDAGSNVELVAGKHARGTDPNVNYRPLEQLWAGLDELSQRVILNRYDEDAEKWLLQPLNPASDIYSVGATIYAIATGVIPPDALDRSIAAIEGKPDPLQAPAGVDPAIPIEISDVIVKAMSLRREDRFYSAVILRQVFRTAAVRVKEREAGTSQDTIEQSAPRAEVTRPAAVSPAPEKSAVPATIGHEKEKARELAMRILAEKAADPPTAEQPVPKAPLPKAEIADTNILEIPTTSAKGIEITHAPPQREVHEVAVETGHTEAKHAGSSWRLPAIAVAAVMVVAAIGGGIYKFAGSTPAVSQAPISASTQLTVEPQPEAAAVLPSVTPEPELASPSTVESEFVSPESGATREKQSRTAQAATSGVIIQHE